MKRLYILLFSCFFVFNQVSGQTSNNDTVSIDWQPDVHENLFGGGTSYHPYFEGAYTTAEFGLMPCYFTTIDIEQTQTLRVSVIPLQTDTISLQNQKNYPDADVLTNDWQTIIRYRHEQASVYVLPLKADKGKIVRLVKFKLKTTIINNSRKPEQYFIPSYTDESVLSNGTWYKIGITQSGVYKIGYPELAKMNIDPASIHPENIRIYGQYSGMLPEANAKPRPDDLLENAIQIIGGEDGHFDEGDLILFYGQGPTTWKYSSLTGKYVHQNNLYSDTVFYFLNTDLGPGKRIQKVPAPDGTVTDTITTFMDYKVIDHDLVNLLMSGKLWVGEVFNKDTSSRVFTFRFPNRLKNKSVFVKMQVLAKGIENSYFSLAANDNIIIDSALILSVSPSSRYYAKKIIRAKDFIDDSDLLNLKLIFDGEDPLNTGWLDYLELNVYRNLVWNNEPLIFSNPKGMETNETDLYKISGSPENLTVWNITDRNNIFQPETSWTNQTTSFISEGMADNQFVAFTYDEALSPVSFKSVPNQNLHGTGMVNMVIVVPPFLKFYAETLADLHHQRDDISSVIVTPEEIYNEFSSGVQDVVAIRDFMRMLYLKGLFESKPPYLLMFGDGSFDYKDRIPDNTNLIPVYESDESLQKTATYGTDDFYGLLDDDEGQNVVGDLDVGIGRFPIATVQEADIVLQKIEHYTIPSRVTMKDWRNVICFIADDQDLNLHLNQAEGLTKIVDTAYPEININKIYIDAFVRQKISSGYRYPDVNRAIDKQVEAGALIMNYTGHGGLDGWADEKILTLPQIRSYKNIDRLPLFITATCEFSRFDDPEFFSAGEQLFLNPTGGAIALLTTTRLAFAHANVVLNRRLYFNLKNTEGNELPRLGDLVRMAKTPAHSNFLNFTLLGDPALRLAFPRYEIHTESISVNGQATDTIRALAKVTVKGKITANGNLVEDFDGYLYPKIFDKKTTYITRANSPKSLKQPFEFFDKVLFDGKITVKNGTFEFSFFVPEGINPMYGNGKISYYAVDTAHLADATGYDRSFTIGGTDHNAATDMEGPQITLYINDPDFQSNDIVDKNSSLFIRLNDESGINYTGIGLGHDITLTIDGDYANATILNEAFVIDKDSYQSGNIVFPLDNLAPGHHDITVKAWDLRNNSNEKTISFTIDDTHFLKFKKVVAYPNPIKEVVCFNFETNLAKEVKVTVKIYNLFGQIIGEMETDEFVYDKGMVLFNWKENVNTQNPGIYFYELIFEDKDNSLKQVFSGKLLKIAE